MMDIELRLPSDKTALSKLVAGDRVTVCGTLFTGRDAAHKRMVSALKEGGELPFDLNGQGIYYVGPCKKDEKPISAGPTTSYRMDKFAPTLYESGILVTIGKGDRSDEVYEAIKKCGGVYLAAIGGAGALYAKSIVQGEVVAYDDLGTEAVHRFEVKDLPAIVAIDSKGGSIYRRG